VSFDNPGRLYFYFDFISHNAWLAWGRAQELAAQHGLAFEPVPVVFGALLKANGQLGPAEVPPKLHWMLWNVLRKARLHGIPLAPPHSHPFNPLAALRLACCELPAAQRLRLIDRIFRATWAESRAVSEPEVLRELVLDCGLDDEALLAESQSDSVKARLRESTEAALAAGVFGVPSVRVRGELFWGFDDLPFLEQFLQGVDPLGDPAEHQAWLQVRPSVQRTR